MHILILYLTRNGWKRYALHNGANTLAASLHTIEVENDVVDQLSDLLDQDQRSALIKYGWLIVDDIRISLSLVKVISDLAKESPARLSFPLSLDEGFRLVAANLAVPKNRRFLTTFMLPPHPSVIEAGEKVQEELKTTPVQLTKGEIRALTLAAIESFFLSHAELKDAEEMIYSLNQFVRRGLSVGQKIRQIHVGGAAHAGAIRGVLREYFPRNSQQIRISTTYDPRFGVYQGAVSSFFNEQIPFGCLVGAIKVKDFEVTADPQKVATEVRASINGYPDDFRKRILVWRILSSKPQKDTQKAYSSLQKYSRELNKKDMAELEGLLISNNQPQI